MKSFKEFINEVKADKKQLDFLTTDGYISRLGVKLSQNSKKGGVQTIEYKAGSKSIGKKAFAQLKADVGRFDNVDLNLTGLDDVIEVIIK